MIQKIKNKLLILCSLLMLALPAAVPAAAFAAGSSCTANGGAGQNCIQGGLCAGAQNLTVTPDQTGCTEQDTGLQGTVKTVINVLSVIVGIAAVIMIIVAGFRYITSGGKQESVTGAKNTILYAVVGLVIVALAQVIVRFVLTRTTSATG
jgi:hypothetical protein